MDYDSFLSYHRDRIEVWEAQVDQYQDQLEALEYFHDADDPLRDEEVEELQKHIQAGVYKLLPDAKQEADRSLKALLPLDKMVRNSLNHDHTYDELPDSEEQQEWLRDEIEDVKQFYQDVKDKQEDAYDQTAELFGPFIREDSTYRGNVGPTNGQNRADTSESSRKSQRSTAPRKQNSSYMDQAMDALSDPDVQSGLALAALFGAAWLGERMEEQQDDDERSDRYDS